MSHQKSTETGTTLSVEDRGQILIVVAVALLMIMSITALSIDAAFMYDKRNELHAAADGAAIAGAIELRRDSTLSTGVLKQFADQQVATLGYSPAACGASTGTSVCINHPPVNGPFNCANSPTVCNFYVEAILSQPAGTFFARLFGLASMTPAARAVAGVSPGPNCMIVMDHVIIKSPATGSLIDMGGCSMIIDGNGSPPNDLNNKGVINARTIGVHHVGTAGCTNNCTNVTYGVAPASDPLITLPPLPNPGGATCTTPFAIAASSNITILQSDINKYYCGMQITGSGTPGTIVTFETGKTFYINGPITDSGGSQVVLNGDGVLIYLSPTATLGFTSSNNVILNMTAATSGTYTGILFYQDRLTPQNTPAIFGKNNTTLAVRGAFYFPTANVQMNNENSQALTNPCMVIVAWAIEVDKPQFLLNNSCISFAGSPLMTLSLAE